VASAAASPVRAGPRSSKEAGYPHAEQRIAVQSLGQRPAELARASDDGDPLRALGGEYALQQRWQRQVRADARRRRCDQPRKQHARIEGFDGCASPNRSRAAPRP